MTEEDAKRQAEFLIERGYIEGKDADQLAKEILESINNSVSRDTPISTDSNTE